MADGPRRQGARNGRTSEAKSDAFAWCVAKRVINIGKKSRQR